MGAAWSVHVGAGGAPKLGTGGSKAEGAAPTRSAPAEPAGAASGDTCAEPDAASGLHCRHAPAGEQRTELGEAAPGPKGPFPSPARPAGPLHGSPGQVLAAVHGPRGGGCGSDDSERGDDVPAGGGREMKSVESGRKFCQ